MLKNYVKIVSVPIQALYKCKKFQLFLRNNKLSNSCNFYCTSKNDDDIIKKTSKLVTSFLSKDRTKMGQEISKDEDTKQQQAPQSMWRTMKYTLLFIGISFGTLGTYLLFELGKAPLDPAGGKGTDEFSHLPVYQQYFYRTVRELEFYSRIIKEPSRDKLLPDIVKPPYYQPPYTLIIEMTDVLVHPEWTYKTGWRFKKRPGIDHFLESLNGTFEIVIFTAEPGMTVFPIVEALDPNNYISYKLVRDATHFVDGTHVKDLSKLNRDLNRVIVVDWNQESVKFHKENLFCLPKWNGNDDDNSLMDLASFLKTVASSEIDDVRGVLKYYNQFSDPLQTFREKQKLLMEKSELDRIEQKSKYVPPIKP